MKRVFIIHGWEANPEMHWFFWLKKKLEEQGFKVEVPVMPNTMEPKVKEWPAHLAKIVGKLDEQTYFVGHSIGCQAILRYLAKGRRHRSGGVVLVAPWFKLTNLETEEEKMIAKPWLEEPIDFNKLKNSSKFIGIFSNNDPYVPLVNSEILKKKLVAEIIIIPNAGHFNFEDGFDQLPTALNAVLKIARK